MISDGELLRAMKIARDKGEISFHSDDVERDRQKIYRVIKAEKELAPLFASTFDFTVNASAEENRITLRYKHAESLLLIPTPVKEKAVEKPKRARKKLPWIEKAEKDIDSLEAFVNKHESEFTAELLEERREYIMIRRIAIEYYYETKSEDFVSVIKGGMEAWPQQVQEAFNPYFIKDEFAEFKPLNSREALAKRMGEIRNSSNPEEQREFEHLLREHDRLVKLDDQKWQNPDNLLG